MYLDQFFRGNPDNIPEAQAMAEDIGSIKKVCTDIAQELNDCCEEIRALIKEVLGLIPSSFARQRFFISTKFTDLKHYINDSLTAAAELLSNHITESKEHLKHYIQIEADGVKEDLKEYIQVEADGIKEDLKEYIRIESDGVKQDVKPNLDYAEGRIIAALGEGLASLTTAITAAVEGLLEAQTAFLLTAIGTVEATVDTIFQ